MNDTTDNKRIIDINGVKVEIDLSTVKVISNYKIGDTVKVLRTDYSGSYISYVGLIVGFDNFEKLPTLIIAYLKTGYSEANIETLYFNSATKDVEIMQACEHELNLDYASAKDLLQHDIDKKREKLATSIRRQDYFEKYFSRKFGDVATLEGLPAHS